MLAVRLLCLAAAALALARALPTLRASPGDAPTGALKRPNVLLVSIDSLRRDHVHAYGYARETTPTIDRLAREGVLFEQAVSMSSWTLPAHMSLFTSMPPLQHGLTKVQRRLAREVQTLPRVFQANGYATAGFVACPLLSSSLGFAQGFDHYDDYTLPQNAPNAADRGLTSPGSLALVNGWLDAWQRGGRAQPFFIFLHLWDVHYDYAPPPPYDRMFDPDYGGTMTGDRFLANREIHPEMDPRDLAHVIALYDGEIRYTDDHLGRLVDRLADLGLLDDTILVVTSDHGDEFFEHGGKGHGLTVYDELILVPLVVRYPPRIPAGQRIPGQVRHVDVGPTLLSLAAVAAPTDFGTRGRYEPMVRERDLTPWITGDPQAAPFPELVAIPETQMIFGFGAGAVRTAERKLIEYNHPRNPRQLFDVRRDPGERTDLAAAQPATAERLSAVRKESHRALADWTSPTTDHLLDEETRARLRALGYGE
jgi:arylsulfatase A-like enzyme